MCSSGVARCLCWLNFDTDVDEDQWQLLPIRHDPRPHHHGGGLLAPEDGPLGQRDALDVAYDDSVCLRVVDGLDGEIFFVGIANWSGRASSNLL